MAYKFQTGTAYLEGATTFEDALVGESTISGAAGSFDALGGTSLALQSGGITAAGPLAGVTTLGMGGALTGVTTLAASSTATIEGVVSGAAGQFDALSGTSLALQSGGITAAGAIAGATTIDASGDLTVGSITNAEFTVDSSGNTDIDGTLNVEGVPTFQAAAVFSGGITTAGALGGVTSISGSSTLQMVGESWLGGALNVSGAVEMASSLTVDGAFTAEGNIDLGNAVTDSITCTARFDADLIPLTDSAVDLGTSALQYAEAHIDHGYIDAITATGTSTLTTVDINGGNIDGTVIGAASVAAGSFAAIVGTTANLSSTLTAVDISGSSTLQMAGATFLGGALNVSGACDFANANVYYTANLDTAFAPADDAIYFRDDDSGAFVSRSWDTIMGQVAGTGITNTSGVLSVSAVSTPSSFDDDDNTMVEGLNYANEDWTGAHTLTLPDSDDLDVGESVKIKMMTGVSTTNTATIAIKGGSGDLIDGAASIVLESPYAAVGLFKVAANVWRIM